MAALLLLLFLSSLNLGSSHSRAPPTGYTPFDDGTVPEEPRVGRTLSLLLTPPSQPIRAEEVAFSRPTIGPTLPPRPSVNTTPSSDVTMTAPGSSEAQPRPQREGEEEGGSGPRPQREEGGSGPRPQREEGGSGPRPQREEGGSGGRAPVPTALQGTEHRAAEPDPPDTPGTQTSGFQTTRRPHRGSSFKTAAAQKPTALAVTVKPSPSGRTGGAGRTTTVSPPSDFPPETNATLHRTAAPSHPTAAPSHPTAAPSHPTAAPSHPTAAPSHPTAAPSHPTAAHTTARAGLLTGELTAITRSTRQESSASTVEPPTSKPTSEEKASPSPHSNTTTSTQREPHSPGVDPQPNTTQPNIRGGPTTQPHASTKQGGTPTPAAYLNITLFPTRTNTQPTRTSAQPTRTSAQPTRTSAQPTGTTVQPTNATQPRRTTTTTTAQSTETGNTFLRNTTGVPGGRGRQGGFVTQKNRSAPLGRPAPPPTAPPPPPPNGTMLLWDDLCRTLAFAWPLHVYGSAGLFLLLFAGAALGLLLSPGMRSPHRGALCLANGLLFLAGGLRACLFLVDPYGSRLLLPRPALTALYNVPLPLLVWSQAALALPALRQGEVEALPPAPQRPPLAAVMAVLQCTVLLAADLLAPALSPAVPVTLQVLSLLWGLVVCLGFLCYVFPRLRCPAASAGGVSGGVSEAEGKPWPGGGRTGLVLGRVLAVCALLGALCCLLHVHATLWLYGILGEWRRFTWGWWLVHFWARLLELAWGFSLLLLGSWVFWRPAGAPGSEEEGSWAFWRPAGGPGDQEGGAPGDGRTGGELPSPGQSAASSHRHTCWSKIVQSLTGKSCKKSDSNGVLGVSGGGAGGEAPPNNWAGLQERPAPPGGGGGGGGADISKSLIRNQSSQHDGGKNSNHGRNLRSRSAERGDGSSSTGSLLRGAPPPLTEPSYSSLSLYDLRPPSPIDLGRSIDDALHREHLLGAGSLFQPLSLGPSSPYPPPSPPPGGPWLLRRNDSDPQLLSDSSSESSRPLGGGSVMSSVPSRQVTEPPTPSHQGGGGALPSSASCPVSLQRPSSLGEGEEGEGGDDTRPFLTPDSERLRGGRGGRGAGSRSYLEVSRLDESNSVSSEIIDL